MNRPSLTHLSEYQVTKIVDMWANRKDTQDIALALAVPEHAVERVVHTCQDQKYMLSK